MSLSISVKPPSLRSVALPIFGEFGLHLLVNLATTLLISRQSESAAAAINTVFVLLLFCYMLLRFVTMGASVVATQYLGAGDRKNARAVAADAFNGSLWLGCVLALILSLGAGPILKAWSFPADLMPYAKPYLQVLGILLVLEAPNQCLIALMRAYGHARSSFQMNLVSYAVSVSGLAMVLYAWHAPILAKMPVIAGTVLLGRLFFLAGMWWLQKSVIDLPWRGNFFWKIHWQRLKPVLAIGGPAAAENVAYQASFMLILKFIGLLGAKAMVAQSFVRIVMNFILTFGLALGLATEVVIGYQVGAGDLDGAERQLRRSLFIGWLFTAGLAISAALFAEPILRLFTQDPETLALGIPILRLCVLVETGRTFNLIVINALRAAGDVRFAVYFGTLSMWGIAVPLAWALGLHSPLALMGVWLAYAADEWVRGLANGWRWRQGHWRRFAAAIKHRMDGERAK